MKEEKKVRGIFEFPGGSGVWWVNVYIAGKRHRKKIGRKSDAAAYYQKAKADARRDILLPELRPKAAPITFGDLAEAAVEHAKTHLRAGRTMTGKREHFGSHSVYGELQKSLLKKLASGSRGTHGRRRRLTASGRSLVSATGSGWRTVRSQ